jgi:hypothetical protein
MLLLSEILKSWLFRVYMGPNEVGGVLKRFFRHSKPLGHLSTK